MRSVAKTLAEMFKEDSTALFHPWNRLGKVMEEN